MVDLTPDGRPARALVAWNGLFQAAHALVNARALLLFGRGQAGFPASPPAGGWPEGVLPWLLGMAGLDLANALLALVFVVGFATGRRWWYPAGVVAVAVSVYASLLFAIGTVLLGAWAAHPFTYAALYLAFLPVYLLFGLLLSWGVDGPARVR